MKIPNVEAIKVYQEIEQKHTECINNSIKYENLTLISKSYYDKSKVYKFIPKSLKDILWKKELKKLGFEYLEEYKTYALILKNKGLELNINSGNIYLMNNETIMTLFPYDHEKLKQLIKILSWKKN